MEHGECRLPAFVTATDIYEYMQINNSVTRFQQAFVSPFHSHDVVCCGRVHGGIKRHAIERAITNYLHRTDSFLRSKYLLN
jgi:hypothetical protein